MCSGDRRPFFTFTRIVAVGAAIPAFAAVMTLAFISLLLAAMGGVAGLVGRCVSGAEAAAGRKNNKKDNKARARAGAIRQSRMSSMAFLIAVWCVAGADTATVPESHDCVEEEHGRFETEATLDPSLGNYTLDELSAAELTQICDQTRFLEAMVAIRRRQRGDQTPNHADLVTEAEKCLVLDKMRSSDPKKWTRDIMSLFYEQYTLFGQENTDIRRQMFVSVFQTWAFHQVKRKNLSTSPEREQELKQEWMTDTGDLYLKAAEFFVLPDEAMPDAGSLSAYELLFGMNAAQEAYINMEFYRIVDWIELDEFDEKNFLWMLSYIDPSALERLISGDVPDLKSMQPRMTVDGIAVSALGVIVFGCTLLLKRSGIFNETGGKDENGRRGKVGGKKKRGRKH